MSLKAEIEGRFAFERTRYKGIERFVRIKRTGDARFVLLSAEYVVKGVSDAATRALGSYLFVKMYFYVSYYSNLLSYGFL